MDKLDLDLDLSVDLLAGVILQAVDDVKRDHPEATDARQFLEHIGGAWLLARGDVLTVGRRRRYSRRRPAR